VCAVWPKTGLPSQKFLEPPLVMRVLRLLTEFSVRDYDIIIICGRTGKWNSPRYRRQRRARHTDDPPPTTVLHQQEQPRRINTQRSRSPRAQQQVAPKKREDQEIVTNRRRSHDDSPDAAAAGGGGGGGGSSNESLKQQMLLEKLDKKAPKQDGSQRNAQPGYAYLSTCEKLLYAGYCSCQY